MKFLVKTLIFISALLCLFVNPIISIILFIIVFLYKQKLILSNTTVPHTPVNFQVEYGVLVLMQAEPLTIKAINQSSLN